MLVLSPLLPSVSTEANISVIWVIKQPEMQSSPDTAVCLKGFRVGLTFSLAETTLSLEQLGSVWERPSVEAESANKNVSTSRRCLTTNRRETELQHIKLLCLHKTAVPLSEATKRTTSHYIENKRRVNVKASLNQCTLTSVGKLFPAVSLLSLLQFCVETLMLHTLIYASTLRGLKNSLSDVQLW